MTEQGEYGVGVPGLSDHNEFAEWSKRMVNSINVGGQWAVPRSGLIYEKRSETHLVLHSLLDPDDIVQNESGVDITVHGITREDQWADHRLITRYMALAGITVTNETDLGEEQ